jgi:hypothetical protein
MVTDFGALKIGNSSNPKIKSRFYIRRLYAKSYLWTLSRMKHVLLEKKPDLQTSDLAIGVASGLLKTPLLACASYKMRVQETSVIDVLRHRLP